MKKFNEFIAEDYDEYGVGMTMMMTKTNILKASMVTKAIWL